MWLLLRFTSAPHDLKAGRIHAPGAVSVIIGTDELAHHPICQGLDDLKKASGELVGLLVVMLIRKKFHGSRHFLHLFIRQSV